jgi:AraC-like DNA-binding protein
MMPPATSSPRYEEMAPPARLAEHLACLWVRRDGASESTPVMPDGCADLMWMVYRGRGRLVVAGPDTHAHPAGIVPATTIAAVRFRPGAAAEVLGMPLDGLRDERPDLADLWGTAATEALAEAVATADRPEQMLTEAVAGRLEAGDGRVAPVDPTLRHVADALEDAREPSPVRGLADAMGLSERQLHRRCLAAFGYGPKTLHRVLRFQNALRRARAGDDLARVAHECGYADQAHMARDVSALSGTTMTALIGY